MNIDLLLNDTGQAGLIASENLIKKAIGITLSSKEGQLTIEFADADTMHLNTLVTEDLIDELEMMQTLHIGAIMGGHIAQAYQVPLLFEDDPYRLETLQAAEQHPQPLQAFNYFIKTCTRGQPVHREEVSDEQALGCILEGHAPASLQFAPHLARRVQLEKAQKAQPNVPTQAPGIGLGGSGGTTTNNTSGNQGNNSQ